jgi:hypothetical protein
MHFQCLKIKRNQEIVVKYTSESDVQEISNIGVMGDSQGYTWKEQSWSRIHTTVSVSPGIHLILYVCT